MTTPVVHCLWQKISESNLILTLNPVFIQLEAFGLSCISDVHRRCSHTVRMDPPPSRPCCHKCTAALSSGFRFLLLSCDRWL